VFDYRDLTIAADPAMGFMVGLRCTGDLVIDGITMDCIPGFVPGRFITPAANNYESGSTTDRTEERNPDAGYGSGVMARRWERGLTLAKSVSAFTTLRCGCGGVGGTGGAGVPVGVPTNSPDGIIERLMRLRGIATFTPDIALWMDAAFYVGAWTISERVTPFGPNTFDSGPFPIGGGCLKIMIDGDLNMEGATLSANGGDQIQGVITSSRSAGGGGGSVIIVCRGKITCGAGATIKANGGAAANGNAGGGGYVAVIANEIEGQLNIECVGGNGSNAGNGGYAEVITALPPVLAPAFNVLKGTGATTSYSRDGESIVGSISEDRIPAAGGLI
jgi:hypothetical protein